MLKYTCGLCYGIYVMKIFKKKFAFTLAEILITISIVGVLAALTIPTLSNHIGDQEHIARYKAMFTRLETALNAVSVEKIYHCYQTPSEKVREKYFPNLTPNFSSSASKGCYSEEYDGKTGELLGRRGLIPDIITLLGGDRVINFATDGITPDSEIGKYRADLQENDILVARIHILKDGTFLMLRGRPRFTNVMLDSKYIFYMDTNGIKRPNMLGKDIFCMSFYITDARVTVRDDKVIITPWKVELFPNFPENYGTDNVDEDHDPELKMYKRVMGAMQ